MFARPSHHHSGEGQEGADMTTKAFPRADKRNFGESSARISEIAYSKTVLWRTLATILVMLVLATLIWLALKYFLGVADAGQRTSGTIAALGSIGGAFFWLRASRSNYSPRHQIMKMHFTRQSPLSRRITCTSASTACRS